VLAALAANQRSGHVIDPNLAHPIAPAQPLPGQAPPGHVPPPPPPPRRRPRHARHPGPRNPHPRQPVRRPRRPITPRSSPGFPGEGDHPSGWWRGPLQDRNLFARRRGDAEMPRPLCLLRDLRAQRFRTRSRRYRASSRTPAPPRLRVSARTK
jgi:hypothetical protein